MYTYIHTYIQNINLNANLEEPTTQFATTIRLSDQKFDAYGCG